MSAAQCRAAAAKVDQGRASVAALRAEHDRERQRLERERLAMDEMHREEREAAMVALQAKHTAAKDAQLVEHERSNHALSERERQEEEACARLVADFQATLATLPFLGDDIFVLASKPAGCPWRQGLAPRTNVTPGRPPPPSAPCALASVAACLATVQRSLSFSSP